MIVYCQPLVRAIVETLFFLETCSDDEVDPDAAVRVMESVASALLCLSEEDQRRLRTEFERVARASDDAGYARFVAGLGDMIDLAR